jgi:hypothetical protein
VSISNPYTNFDLFIPDTAHRLNETLVASSGGGEYAAFDRQIDLWWTGLMLGVRAGRRSAAATTGNLIKFNTGSILTSDPWRIPILELVAIAEVGPAVLREPREVINIASEYAYTGLTLLADRLRGSPVPLIGLAGAIEDLGTNAEMLTD